MNWEGTRILPTLSVTRSVNETSRTEDFRKIWNALAVSSEEDAMLDRCIVIVKGWALADESDEVQFPSFTVCGDAEEGGLWVTAWSFKSMAERLTK